MEKSEFCGVDQAAILIMALGEDLSADILKYLTPNEIFAISNAITKLHNVTKEAAVSVMENFSKMTKINTGLALGSEEYLLNTLTRSIGKEKADNIMERISFRGNNDGLESLRWMDSDAVLQIIHQEHPQIIAIILSYLDPDQSAKILENLSDKLRVNIMMRIASLESVQPSAISDLNQTIENQVSDHNRMNLKTTMINGIKKAANILSSIDNKIERNIIGTISDHDAVMAEKIQDAMFVFEELVNFNDKDIQAILREITSESLVLAMKGSDENLKTKVFTNLSKRAGSMLQEDLDNRGPVQLKEIELAKKEILGVVRRLAMAGDISAHMPAGGEAN